MAIYYKKLKSRNKDERIKQKLELKGKLIEEQNAIKKYRLRYRISSFLTLFIFFVAFTGFVVLIQLISFNSSNGFVKFLFVVVKIILYIIGLIISGLLAAIPVKLIPYNKTNRTYIEECLKKERQAYCKIYRDYYGLTDDFIITACYKCFDEMFSNKTICLFRKNNKLCFCADIVNGFINQKSDFGLYEIDYGTFNVEEYNFNGKQAYKLIIDEKEIIFAQKAKKMLFSNQNNKGDEREI